MNESLLSTALLLPFELLLPVLGILLIQSESPINSLIYRSFLGSIAALIYALIGAPDVALTEVMVGTLLSSLIYIVTIRSCYSIVIVVNQESPPTEHLKNLLKSSFEELHLRITYQEEQISETDNSPFDLLLSSKLSGSPHAMLLGTTLYFEVNTLLKDFAETQIYSELSKLIDIKLTPSKS